MQDIYKVAVRPAALQDNIITGKSYRITVLTEGLIRLEYDPDGEFEDRATQTVLFRDFPTVEKRVIRNETGVEIHTSKIYLYYNEEEFSAHGLRIKVKGKVQGDGQWYYGKPVENLGATARTLDGADGEIPLEHGIIARQGYAVLDDSRSLILLENGWIAPRKKGSLDLYFFGYGHAYKEALGDFYRLCGKTPMLPRFALGNWWSRYYPYTESSYLALMDRFEKEDIPFTVAVIDMDWHLVDIDPKYGSGWTGYTWNRELFPDPQRFMKELHDRGMKVTLNVHPADGIRGHEDMYENMARVMGVDTTKEDPVAFDPSSPRFMEAYFEYVHHPREEEGVDFWWVDWQQGSDSRQEGLDPLWILNHFHFLDSGRGGGRPMTFSRYAGPGSHRYPIGFSGDTIVTWESLDFQPFFTATAANIGYGWWSHDIGGHMQGYRDEEMTVRWVQLGIYSPILRLHSSNGEFFAKEPWRYGKEAELAMKEALRERHRMLPYLYAMNERSSRAGLPVVMPLYYEYPEEEQAYLQKNQFFFGDSLMVAPITSPCIKGLKRGGVKVWLPEGEWYDIHTGIRYEGGRTLYMYRDLYSIPVLAKAGSILPFTDETETKEAVKNPESLCIKIYPGENGRFSLYEDDNTTRAYEEGKCVHTLLEYEEYADEAVFTIHPPRGCVELLPEKRRYRVEIAGCHKVSVQVSADDEVYTADTHYDKEKQILYVELPEVSRDKTMRVTFSGDLRAMANPVLRQCFMLLDRAEMQYAEKERIYTLIKQKGENLPVLVAELSAMKLDSDLYRALLEILTASL